MIRRRSLGPALLALLLLAGACGDDDDEASPPGEGPEGADVGEASTDGEDAAAGAAGGASGDTGTTSTAPVASGTFTSLTYNVAGLPAGINPDQFPEEHQPLISPLLDAYDVVVVQEDFGTYTDVLRSEADHEHMSEPHPGPQVMNPIGRAEAAVGDGLNVLSRLPIGPLERVPWTGCGPASGDCLALKGFARTTLELDEGVSIELYTLHVEAGRDDAALRGEDMAQLAAHLAARPDRAVIIGGDWNLEYADDPDGEQLRGFLEQTGTTDVCDVVDCGADADVIDRFVFRSGDDVTLTPTSHAFERETFVDSIGRPLSDHDPLAVEWSWSATG